MSNASSRPDTKQLVRLAVLTAVILVMAFTPLGYFKTGGLSVTLLQIPVVIGSILLGPASGAVLGAVFGLTSVLQCFGLEPFGTTLMGINPIGTLLVCLVPRVLMGLLAGLLFRGLNRGAAKGLFPYAATCLAGAVLNTLLFMGLLIAFFFRTEFLQGIASALGAASPIPFIAAFVGVNGVIEAAVCCVVGAAISRTLHLLSKSRP